MIQFNLLPDIKIEYIKAEKLKRLIIGVSAFVAAASIVVCMVLFIVVKSLEKHSGDLSKDINANVQKLQGTKDLDRILTIQNQLKTLPTLHSGKPEVSRIFTYMSQVTPGNVTLSKLDVDFESGTLILAGGAEDLLSVNKFVDTLKFTNMKIGGDTPKTSLAFSAVTLTTFGATEKAASYTITLGYDKQIFDNQIDVSLDVPKTITTRSELNLPIELFKPEEPKKKAGN